MLVRTFLSLVNLAVLFSTLSVWLLLPAYSTYALYGCLGWVVVAFAVMYSAWGNRPFRAPARATAAGGGAASSGGGVGAGGAGGAPPIDFCIYCAASLPAGASRCPACGHAGARG